MHTLRPSNVNFKNRPFVFLRIVLEDEQPNLIQTLFLGNNEFLFSYINEVLEFLNLRKNEKPKHFIVVQEESLEIHFKGDVISVAIQSLEDFKIYWTTRGDDEGFEKAKSPRVVFESDGQKYRYFFKSNRKEYLPFCKALYRLGVDVKEFQNEGRVYLGRFLNYKQIQQFKAKYQQPRS